MPIAFTINKPRQTFENQWAYLARRGRDTDLFVLKKLLVIMGVVTGLYLLLYFLTAMDDFVILKGVGMVMIALGWCVMVILYPLFGIKNMISRRRLQQFLDATTEEQLSYSVQIDEEKVTIISTSNTYELPWTEFTLFGIHNETIYVFNAVKALNSLYWDRDEMGSENFLALLELLQRKLIKKTF